MNVSRDYALCVLFGLDFTDNNVIKTRSKLESYGNLEICYDLSGRNPVLIPKERINFDLFTYKRYLLATPPITSEADSKIMISKYIKNLRCVWIRW